MQYPRTHSSLPTRDFPPHTGGWLGKRPGLYSLLLPEDRTPWSPQETSRGEKTDRQTWLRGPPSDHAPGTSLVYSDCDKSLETRSPQPRQLEAGIPASSTHMHKLYSGGYKSHSFERTTNPSPALALLPRQMSEGAVLPGNAVSCASAQGIWETGTQFLLLQPLLWQAPCRHLPTL